MKELEIARQNLRALAQAVQQKYQRGPGQREVGRRKRKPPALPDDFPSLAEVYPAGRRLLRNNLAGAPLEVRSRATDYNR